MILQEQGVCSESLVDANPAQELHKEGEKIADTRSGTFSSKDIQRRVFPDGPPKAKTLKQLKEGIAEHVRARHARR